MQYRESTKNTGQPERPTPPKLALALAKFLCHPDFVEEIEGDLSEKFEMDVQKFGVKTARRKLNWHVLSLMKFNLMFNFNNNIMSRKSWIKFILTSFVIVAAAFVPFLPGPYSFYFVGISVAAQLIGFFGVVVIPIGLILLVINIRKRKSKQYRFNPVPLYLIVLPLLSLCTRVFLIERVADYSRDTAIKNSLPIIEAIEKFKSDHNEYPSSLEQLTGKYLDDIPTSNIMGINSYKYVNNGQTYELSFVQWMHWGATEERVIYTLNGHEKYKGHFASFDTAHAGWRYYWRD